MTTDPNEIIKQAHERNKATQDPRIRIAGLKTALKAMYAKQAAAASPETRQRWSERITETERELAEADEALAASAVTEEDDDYSDIEDEDGAALLDDLRTFITRFVHFADEHQDRTVPVWVLHTWAISSFDFTPRLFVRSHVKQSGKSRLLELLHSTTRRAISMAGTSAAALFRSIEAGEQPTVLLDEVDTMWGNREPTSGVEAIRQVVNAGYSRQVAVIQRVERNGDELTVVDFDTFAPMALGGIGKRVPATVLDRSIIITLERAKRRSVAKYRQRFVRDEASQLRRRCAAWVERHGDEIIAATDEASELMPDVSDRAQDVWEPLLQLAITAGGDWPKAITSACEELNKHRDEIDQSDERVEALEALREVYAYDFANGGRKFVATVELATRLNAVEYSPFASWNRYEGITQHQLARWLRETFDLITGKGPYLGQRVNGYTLEQVKPLFDLYLSVPLDPDSDANSDSGKSVTRGDAVRDVYRVVDVPDDKQQPTSGGFASNPPGQVCRKRLIPRTIPSKRPARRPISDEEDDE